MVTAHRRRGDRRGIKIGILRDGHGHGICQEPRSKGQKPLCSGECLRQIEKNLSCPNESKRLSHQFRALSVCDKNRNLDTHDFLW